MKIGKAVSTPMKILYKIRNIPVSLPTIFQRQTTKYFGKLLLKLGRYSVLSNLYLYRPTNTTNTTNKSRIRLLSQEKGIFNSEVEYLFDDRNKYSLFRLNRILTKMICNHVYEIKVNQHNYKAQRKNNIKRKQHFAILDSLMAKKKFDAIITFNFGDGETGGLIEATSGKIKSICLHKEGVMSKNFMESYFQTLTQNRDKFRGDMILVYNESMRNLLLRTGHYDADRVKVVGAPRFDLLFSQSQQSPIPKQHKMVMFYPSPFAQLSTLLDQEIDFSWRQLGADFAQTVSRLATQYPNTSIVVKAKARDRDAFDTSLLAKSNVSFTVDRLAMDLLADATLCLGFNSSALIESAAFGVPTVHCCFGEANHASKKNWIIDFGALTNTARNVDEALTIVENILCCAPQRNPLSKAQKQDLDRLVGNADGKSKQRILSHF